MDRVPESVYQVQGEKNNPLSANNPSVPLFYKRPLI